MSLFNSIVYRLFMRFHLRPNGVTTESQMLKTVELGNLLGFFFLNESLHNGNRRRESVIVPPVSCKGQFTKKPRKSDGIFSSVKLNNDFVYLFDKRRFLGCEQKGVHVHVCDFYHCLLIFLLSSLGIRGSGGQIRAIVTLQSGFGKISRACKQACCYLTCNAHRQL